jgi:hypothetical protein
MTQDHEERIYQTVHRMVIWDEPKEEVFQMLEANGIIGHRASQSYERARADRISTLRANATRAAVLGLLSLAAGVGLFLFFWRVVGGFTHKIFLVCAAPAAFGAWKLVNGIIDLFMASTKRGSLADDI